MARVWHLGQNVRLTEPVVYTDATLPAGTEATIVVVTPTLLGIRVPNQPIPTIFAIAPESVEAVPPS